MDGARKLLSTAHDPNPRTEDYVAAIAFLHTPVRSSCPSAQRRGNETRGVFVGVRWDFVGSSSALELILLGAHGEPALDDANYSQIRIQSVDKVSNIG